MKLMLPRLIFSLLFTVFATVPCASQDYLPFLISSENTFLKLASERGPKVAFLEFLTPDSILFRPEAVNGRDYWSGHKDPGNHSLVRKTIYADISSNGMLGYTTGNWRLYKKGRSEADADFGQYVTIWERNGAGQYRVSLDIATTHEKLPFSETDRVGRVDVTRDPNERGWSPADASMNFHRMSMTSARLGGAYQEFAAKDVRLLIEREPPVIGKKRVVREMERYVAVAFPSRVVSFQATDLAYTWNPCKFANNDEGLENGNCLHIWKLRGKKWWIVLGVFARFPNEKQPSLKAVSK